MYLIWKVSMVVLNPKLGVDMAALLHCILPLWKVLISLHKQAQQRFHMNTAVYRESIITLWSKVSAHIDVPFLFSGVFVLLILVYGLTVLISSCGNSLVLWIVSTTKSLQNVNNLLIANLAISDITIAVICTPFQFYAALLQRFRGILTH